MPYTVRYLRKKKCYSVINKNTRKVFSKCTTRQNAQKQSRLLRAIKYNPGFVKKLRNNNTRKNIKNPRLK